MKAGDGMKGEGRGTLGGGEQRRGRRGRGERPTDRRMRPAVVFNWEEGWDLFLWARSHHQYMGGEMLSCPALPLPFPRYLSSPSSPRPPIYGA